MQDAAGRLQGSDPVLFQCRSHPAAEYFQLGSSDPLSLQCRILRGGPGAGGGCDPDHGGQAAFPVLFVGGMLCVGQVEGSVVAAGKWDVQGAQAAEKDP